MRTSPSNSLCPRCGQRAPIVLRALEARCAACGAPRPLLASKSLTLTGQPSRVGGVLASISGAFVLVVGLCLALFLGLLLQSIWPGALVGWAFGVPIAAFSVLVGLVLLLGGRRLKRRGVLARREVQRDAVRALAAHSGGTVTSEQVALALSLSEPESDAVLTELAKDPAEDVSLDVDDDGRIHYLFGVPERRWRVLEETAAQSDVALEEEVVTHSTIEDRKLRR